MSDRTANAARRVVVLSSNDLEQLEKRQLMAAATAVSLPFRLDFNQNTASTVVDKDGQGTGFTGIQANKYGTEYQQNLIDLDVTKGTLALTTTGTSSAGSNAGADNTQTNALETAFNGSSGNFQVTTRVLGSPSLQYLDDAYEQAGIYIGPDQDNYVKLVAIKLATGQFLQFKDEVGGVSSVNDAQSTVDIGYFGSITSLDLRLVGDATTGKVTAYYNVNDSGWKKVEHEFTLGGAAKSSFFSNNSKAGLLASHKNNVGPITAVFDMFEIKAGVPMVTGTRPENGETGISRDSFIAADVYLPNSGAGVDSATISAQTVKLYNKNTGALIAGAINTSGGGDAIVFTPSTILDANTTYVFEITDGVKDTQGNSFLPFKTTFTTGTAGVQADTSIQFTKAAQNVTAGIRHTSMTFGPDGKLYATTIDGRIIRYNVASDGTLSSPFTINTITNKEGARRSAISIVFDPASTASNLIAYVSHSDFAGLELKEYEAENLGAASNWTGKITKLTGANLQTAQDLVTGLPRSVRDHQNYQMAFGPDGKLYVSQSSMSAMGRPDNAWGNQAEVLLSAAILQINVQQIGTSTVNVRTDGSNPYNPYASNAPVKIYATGLRSAYDLLFHSNGHLYSATNGSAAGGNTPAGNGAAALSNVPTQHDYMFDVVAGGYYGHPNALRGEYVLNGGNPTSGVDPAEVTKYAVGTQPDANYKGYAYDFGLNYSPNGMIEYKGNAFNGALNGKIMIVRYSGGDDIMVMSPNASGQITGAQTGYTGLTGFVNPLDIIQNPTTGQLYVIEFGDQAMTPEAGGAKITMLSAVASDTSDNGGGSNDNGGNTPSSGTPAATLSRNKVYFSDNKASSDTSLAQTVRITNTGSGPMTITAATFSGTNASEFTLKNPLTGTITLQAGERYDFYVVYKATNANVIRTAQLNITTNAGVQNIALRGLGTNGLGGTLEPSLQKILDLYQIGVNVGDTTPDTTDFPTDSANSADEVTMPRLIKSGTGPVTVEILGTFANQTAASYFGWYQAGSPQAKSIIAAVKATDAQSVAPLGEGAFTFDPGSGAFGIYGNFTLGVNQQINRDVFSENSLNTWESNTSRQKKIRFYKLKDASGNVVPNAYVFAMEEYDQSFDQNDMVGIIRNVQPAADGAEIGTQNLDSGEFADRLVMSRINPANYDKQIPNQVHDTATLRIRNTGNQPLTISQMTLSSADFVFVSGNGPTTIAAGGYKDVVVKFVYNAGGSGNTLRTATLAIASNDSDEPTKNITLSGLWQSHSENGANGVSAEPTAQKIIDALGYKVKLTNAAGSIDTKGVRTRVGEEVLSEAWTRADPLKAVGVTQLAAYHRQNLYPDDNNPSILYATKSTISWYDKTVLGTDGKPKTTKILTHLQEDGQTLFPRLDGTTANQAASASFLPKTGQSFNFKVDKIWGDDVYNTPNDANNPGHGARFYAAKDQNGKIIPDTYILALDFVTVSYANYDYQDNIYIITNLKPVDGPTAATGLTGTGTAAGNSLNWADNGEGNIGGYNVYRSNSANGTFTKINSDLQTTSDFVDSTAPVGVTSYYYVEAVDYHGTKGAASATIGVLRTTGGATLPAAASNLTATAQSAGGVTLAWKDNANNETGFRIERLTNGTWSAIASVGSNTITYTDNTTAASTAYSYRIVALNASGEAAPSNTAAVTTAAPQQTPPGTPTNVVASPQSSTNVNVTWADTTGETSYRIERLTNGTWASLGTAFANATSFVDTTAVAGGTYSYRVVAVNAYGEVGSVASASVTTPLASAMQSTNIGNPTPGGGVQTVTPNKDYVVTVGGVDIWGTYDSFNFIHEQRTGDFDVAVRISGLVAGDAGAMAGLMARESLATGAKNVMIKVKPDGYRLTYRTATNGTTVGAGSGAATVPNAYVRMKRVGNTFTTYTSTDGVNWSTFSTATVSMGSTIYVGMATSGHSTTSTVQAGYRGYGDTVLDTTPPAPTTPAAPSGLTSTANSQTKVTLNWADNASNETGYRIERKIGSGAWTTLVNLGTNATTYQDTTVAAGTTYTYRVIALGSTNSAASNESTVTTPANPAPDGATLTPMGDAFIRNGTAYSSKNYGSDATLEVKYDSGNTGYGRQAYMQFDVSSLASVSSVTLRLYVSLNDVGSVPLALYGISTSANWTESGVTWNNKPATSSKLGQTTVSSTAGQWIEFDVTGYVQGAIAAGRSSVSFNLQATASSSPFIRIASRESANAAELAVNGTTGTTTPPPTQNQPTPTPTTGARDVLADSYVYDGSSASSNFGTGSSLAIKKSSTSGYNRQAYLKFDISNLVDIASAKLRLTVNLNTADSVQMAVYGVNDTSWSETGVTWNNKPATTGGALATTIVNSTTATEVEIDLTAYVKAALAAGKTTITLNLQGTANSTAFISVASQESGNGPQLVFG